MKSLGLQSIALRGLMSFEITFLASKADSIAVVVSEETGAVSIVHGGRMIRRLDSDRLENILNAFFRTESRKPFLQRLFSRKAKPHQSNPGGLE